MIDQGCRNHPKRVRGVPEASLEGRRGRPPKIRSLVDMSHSARQATEQQQEEVARITHALEPLIDFNVNYSLDCKSEGQAFRKQMKQRVQDIETLSKSVAKLKKTLEKDAGAAEPSSEVADLINALGNHTSVLEAAVELAKALSVDATPELRVLPALQRADKFSFKLSMALRKRKWKMMLNDRLRFSDYEAISKLFMFTDPELDAIADCEGDDAADFVVATGDLNSENLTATSRDIREMPLLDDAVSAVAW